MRRPLPALLWLCAGMAVALPFASKSLAENGPLYLDQGWSAEIRELFYYTPEGSRMIPYDWFLALETADGEGLFADSENLSRYGAIPSDTPHALNPGGLPIGFAVDPGDQQRDAAYLALDPDPIDIGGASRYLGLTCAACHTADITVEGRTIRVDGAPAHFDFDSFYADLAEAVALNLADEERFGRFASRVLGTPAFTEVAELRSRFAVFAAELAGDAVIRRPTLQSGFGRVDALTQIVNSIAVRDQGEPTNLRSVGAPTSYPPLWLTSQLEFVQWNPIAASPIGRNGGQVLGVFGSANLTGPPADLFSSTILLEELHALETWVSELRPPSWDEAVFGALDADLAQEGEDLFAENCSGCHNMAPYERTDPEANFFGMTFIEIGRVDYTDVGTDPVYIQSLGQRLVRTNDATAALFDGREIVPAPAFFLGTVGGVLRRAMADAGVSEADQAAMNGFRVRRGATGLPEPYTPPSLTDLKASPLAGVWATGPYLHNGSVPTVYELLSPEDERRDVFWTGGRELDRERLGYVSEDAPGRFRFDASLPGNFNTGHLYPSGGLTHDERMAIIEYLKTQ